MSDIMPQFSFRLYIFLIIGMWLMVNLNISILAQEPKPDFMVAPSGKDTNEGSEAKPFATVARARDEVRKLISAGLKKNIVVLIRGGLYEQETPLNFGPEDSGSEKFSITYTTRSGETAILSGGKKMKNWKRGEGNIWTIDLPEVKAGTWFFRQLFINDKRAMRSQYPKAGGWLSVATCSEDAKTLGFSEKIPFENLGGQDVELLMLHHWSVSRAIIASSSDKQLISETSIGWMGHGPMTCASPGKPVRLENGRAFLSQPGEWCLERTRGILSYCAEEGSDPNKLEIIAPKIENILIVAGQKDKPIRNLHFTGLAFAHSEFPMPSFGYSEIQAGHYAPSMKSKWNIPPVAIEITYTIDSTFEGCRIAHTGSAGIGFGMGCQKNSVLGCNISDIGSNGVMVGWRGKGKLKPDGDWEDATDVPMGNIVANNLITNCGSFNFGGVAIAVMFSADTRIAHNEISDLPYTGISVGFKWDSTPTSQVRCIVESNHIHNVMNMLADGGGIYSLGFQPGTIMRGNHIHGVHRSAAGGGAPNNGFFIDEGSMGFHFEDNIVYDTSAEAVRFNQNKKEGHTWKDNDFTGIVKLLVKGKVGKGLSCDVNTKYLEIAHTAELDAPQLTVEAWVNLPVLPAGEDARRWIVNKNGNEWIDGHYALMVYGGKVGAYLNIGGGEKNCVAAWSETDVLKTNQWQHLAMTYDEVVLKVYFDGKLVASKEVNKSRTIGNTVVTIGRRQDGFSHLQGLIDEVRIYSRVLLPAEIAEHFSKPEEVTKKVDDKLGLYRGFDEDVKNNDRIEKILLNAGLEEPYKSKFKNK